MDAVTLVAAAVAIAIEDSRNAALNDVLLDRERAAMRAADVETQLAERMYNEASQMRAVRRAARLQAARVARERAAAREQADQRAAALLEESDTDSDESHAHACARCGDTSNLEVMPPTGPWVDAPVPARTYCRECLYGS